MTADESVRDRIFATSERLFAEKGFDAVSMREITAAAGVNLAAVNYYFGSKSALLLKIFRRRASELNRERMKLLKQALSRPQLEVREILRAMIEPPTLWTSDERRTALMFLNRARAEGTPEIKEMIRSDVKHLRHFIDALQRALPHLSRTEVLWRFHFAQGVLHHNSAMDYERLMTLSEGACTPDDREKLLERLMNFILAGIVQGSEP